ncbi:helix-turn-helix transcriptional regulator [Bacillus salitolerans]|uniref:Helix-turn-helix transcriptional regulator n=1 Tax=Bacillus salitolerans TaxID=1437434 RepID=A0ABW4LTM8_9BACI
MRADRLLSILLLLQNKGKQTTKALAKELEVTERTIHRDMEALSTAGIPIVADRGKTGGWRLIDDYRTDLTGLKAVEIQSLFISPSSQLLTDLGLSKNWDEARQKLLASLPYSIDKTARDIWNRIHIDTSAWRESNEKLESFHTLKEAIGGDQKLHIHYERSDGEYVSRTVEPLGLVAKGSTWYLIASCEGDIRNYRASRIQLASLTEETFTRPKDFHLEQYWKDSTETFIQSLPTFIVEVEVAPHILQRLKFSGRFAKVIKIDKPTDSGWIPVKISFDTEQEAEGYILGFGNQIRIIHPVHLRERIFKMAQTVVDLYRLDSTE